MDAIRHSGTISGRNGDTFFVTIASQSACSACHAKGVCQAGDMKEKVVEVQRTGRDYQNGQEVTLLLQESAGVKAVLYGYLLPFIVVMVTLVVAINVTGNEITGGLVSLAMLIPYYARLFLFRNRMKTTFHFTLEENNHNSL